MVAMNKDIINISLDIICIFIFAIPLWVYNLLDVVPIAKIGFFCSDNSIRYPYRDSTVSSLVLMIVGFSFIIASSIIVETLLYVKYRAEYLKRTFHPLLVEIFRVLGYFVIGVAMNQFLTDVAKLSIGRLRPHFFNLCLPNVTCNASNEHTYFENYYCQRTSHHLIPPKELQSRLKDARKSFPSGHASFSFYSSLYIIAYLELRVRSQKTRVFRHLVQLGVLVWGVWVSCTRIHDFKHRYSDVAGGMVIGVSVAFFAFYLYFRSFQSNKKKAECFVVDNSVNMSRVTTAVE